MENVKTPNGLARNTGGSVADHVRELVQQVQDELHQLLRQRAELTRRIGTAKQTIVGLAALLGDDVLSEDVQHLVDGRTFGHRPGLTKACRRVLVEADHPVSAREVQQQLLEQTPALLAAHKDPIASVTTILNRLVYYSEAQRVVLADGTRRWQWSVEQTSRRPSLDR